MMMLLRSQRKQILAGIIAAVLLVGALVSCGVPNQAEDAILCKDAEGNYYVLSSDGKTFLYYYPGNESRCFTVPEGVIAIGAGAFRGCESLTSVSLYGTVISINDYAFDGCTSLKRVFYARTSPEWQKVAIGEGNEPLTNASILYNFIN
jgi:hypothetical protein